MRVDVKFVVYLGLAGFAFPVAVVGFQLRDTITSLGEHGLHLRAANPVFAWHIRKCGGTKARGYNRGDEHFLDHNQLLMRRVQAHNI